jgi:ATP-binding cassette subfamily B multidrug efflux pump
VIKSYVREAHTKEVFAKESQGYKDNAMGLVKVQALFYPTMIAGWIEYHTYRLHWWKTGDRRALSAGNIAEFIVYVNQLTFPVSMLGWVTTLIQRASASQKRINEFLQLNRTSFRVTAKSGPQLKGNIKFENVNFTYPDTGIQAFREVSFEIEQGQFVAIIGRTGSGKSTLANLIMRMYDVDQGTVTIDGIALKSLNLQHYRRPDWLCTPGGFLIFRYHQKQHRLWPGRGEGGGN